MIEKDFTPRTEALELKEIGFDEPCLKFYANGKLVLGLDTDNGDANSKLSQYNQLFVSAPTYSQAFRFFRENHKFHSNVKCVDTVTNKHFRYEIESNGETLVCRNRIESYEEAELACLRKMIEIVKASKK